MATKSINFEDALKKLEEVANSLENGELGLDKSIEKYEEGMEYIKLCHKKLEEAEKKIELLQKKDDKEILPKKIKVKEDKGELEDSEDMQGSLL